jgi:hypothetical protein
MYHFFVMPPEAFHGKVPFVVTDLITELRRRNSSSVEGIFRLSGSAAQIDEVCEDLDHGRITNWNKYRDIHTISGALRRYFRDMAKHEPLITRDVYECLMVSMCINDTARQKVLVRRVLSMISPVRGKTLSYLVDYLREITDNAQVSKMTPENMGICFSPNLVNQSGVPPEEIVQDNQLLARATVMMLTNYDEIFSDFPLDDSILCNEEDFIEFSRPPVNVSYVHHQVLRSQSRKGSLIPFVPICKLWDDFQPPTRIPVLAREPSKQARVASYLHSITRNDIEYQEFLTSTGQFDAAAQDKPADGFTDSASQFEPVTDDAP